jgi:hypothetical protein
LQSEAEDEARVLLCVVRPDGYGEGEFGEVQAVALLERKLEEERVR